MWLSAEPIDMRAGTERLLARVVQVFGVAQARAQLHLACERRHQSM